MKIFVFTPMMFVSDAYVTLAENEAGACSKVRSKIADRIASGQIFLGTGGIEDVVKDLSVDEFDLTDVVVIESDE